MALVDAVNRRSRSRPSKAIDVASRPQNEAARSQAFAQQYMSSVFGAANKSGSVAEVKPKPYRDLWHRQAFPLIKAVPEVSYVLNMTSDLLANCRVVLQRRKPNTDEWEDSDDQRGMRVLRDLHGPIGGVGEILRQGAFQSMALGEAWLYGDPVMNDAGRMRRWNWSFKSMPEVLVPRPGDVRLVPWGTNVEEYPARPGTYLKRCLFNPDPEFSMRATSVIFNCLPLLTEMVSASQVIDAILRSQIHAGMFFMPQEVAFGPTNEWDSPGTPATGFDEAEEEMQEFMSGAMNDGTSVNRVQPLLMWGPGVIQRGDKTFPTKDLMGLVPLSREFDDFLRSVRQELIERLSHALNIEPEVLTGMGRVNHFCVDEETEILTQDGWVTHDQLNVGDLVLTLNHETGLSEWQPAEQVNRFDVEDELMVSIEGRFHSSLTTANHRWPVLHKRIVDQTRPTKYAVMEREWRESTDLKILDFLITGAPNADLPTEPKWSDALVELVGWFWTEGQAREMWGGNYPSVAIYQSHGVNPENCARIRRALTSLYGPAHDGPMKGGRGAKHQAHDNPQWREVPHKNRDATIFRLNVAAALPLLDVAPNRVVSLDFIRELTASQLELFIDVSVRADGHYRQDSASPSCAQKVPERMAALELAAILSGRSTNFYEVNHPRTPWNLAWRKRSTHGLQKIDRTNAAYSGVVWCPTTANHTWLARRKGKVFYTGNSGWLAEENYIKKDVVPLGETILNWLTAEQLRPMLQITQGMSPEDSEWFRYALDASPIFSAPDKTNSATAAYNMLALSTESWLDYMGLDPTTDLPSPEEYIVRAMERLVLAQPSVAPNVMPWLAKAKGAEVNFGDIFEDWQVGTSSPGGANLNPQEVNGRQSGPGTPPNEAPQTGRLTATGPIVTEMLSKTADQVLLKAVQTAASRLVASLHVHDEKAAQKLMAEPPSRLLTVAGHNAVQKAHTSISALFAGSFDELATEMVNWLVGDLVNRGVPAHEAQQRATIAANELTTQLETLAASAFDRPLRTLPSGSHVSAELIHSALTAGDLAEVGLPAGEAAA